MTNGSQKTNPYESARATRDVAASDNQNNAAGLSSECCGNLTLTAKLVKIASVILGIGSLVSVFQIIAAFRLYGFPSGWTWWHTLIAYRIVYTPCWLLLAWMLWKYSTSLGRMANGGIAEVEKAMEQQAKAWLALGLLMFVMLIGLAISLSGALSSGIPR